MRKNLEQSAGFGGKSISSNHQALEYIFASGQFPLHWSLVGCSSAPKQEIEWNRYIQETCFSNTSIYSQHSGLSASVTSTSQTSISPKKTKKAGICHFGTLHLVSMPPRELHPLTFPVPVPFTGLTEAPGDSKVKLPCVVTCRTEKRNCSYTAKKSVEAWRDLLNGKFMRVSLDISTRTVVKSFVISRFFCQRVKLKKTYASMRHHHHHHLFSRSVPNSTKSNATCANPGQSRKPCTMFSGKISFLLFGSWEAQVEKLRLPGGSTSYHFTFHLDSAAPPQLHGYTICIGASRNSLKGCPKKQLKIILLNIEDK